MSSIFTCYNAKRTIDFFVRDELMASDCAWAELVFQEGGARVGFDINLQAKAFLEKLLLRSWAFDRNDRKISQIEISTVNIDSLDMRSSVVVIDADQELQSEFDAARLYFDSQRLNILRERYGRVRTRVPIPRILCCFKEGEIVGSKCIDLILNHSKASMLFRRSEHGLTAALFSRSIQTLALLIAEAAAAAQIDIIEVSNPLELPAW